MWLFCSVGSVYARKSSRVSLALGDAEWRLAELQRIEVGVFEDEAQAEGHARQPAQVLAARSTHDPLQVVSEDLDAVVEGESVDCFIHLVAENLDPDAAGR